MHEDPAPVNAPARESWTSLGGRGLLGRWVSDGERLPEVYMAAQVAGAMVGVWMAHAMFGERVFMPSHHARSGAAQWSSEFVATFGLLAVITGCGSRRSEVVPVGVAPYITAAYWFTASTSFANPAVTIARAFTGRLLFGLTQPRIQVLVRFREPGRPASRRQSREEAHQATPS